MVLDIKEFLQVLSSVEKRYGRSIVEIRRQLSVWEEMLESEELLLPSSMSFDLDSQPVNVSFVALPMAGEFSAVFDVMKHISRFIRYNSCIGLDLSNIHFSRNQWSSFLMLLKATVLDGPRVWLTLSLDSAGAINFLYAAQSQELYFCGINLLVPSSFLQALRERSEFEIVKEDLSSMEKIDAFQVLDLVEVVRSKGACIRFVFGDSVNWNDVPALGSRIVFLDSGVSLIPGEAVPECAINLVKILEPNSGNWEFLWEKLADRIHNAVRLLDDLIELNEFPVREIYEVTRRTRRISLRLTGWAEVLCYLGIPYDSEPAVELANKLSKFVQEQSNIASWNLARERGVFPSYRGSELEKQGLKRRNASVFSGAVDVMPISTIKDSQVFPLFDEISRRRGFYSEELMRYLDKKDSLKELEYLPEDIKQVFVVRKDVDLSWQLKMQSAFQEHCDGLVDLKVDVQRCMPELLWKATLFGASGFSLVEKQIYRDLIEDEHNINLPSSKKSNIDSKPALIESRPEVLFGSTVKVETPCGQLLVTINQDDQGRLREVLLRLDKSSGCVGAHLEAISKLLSLLVASGVDISYVIRALEQINCSAIAWNKGKRVFSCADAIAQVLSDRLKSTNSDTSTVGLKRLNSDVFNLN